MLIKTQVLEAAPTRPTGLPRHWLPSDPAWRDPPRTSEPKPPHSERPTWTGPHDPPECLRAGQAVLSLLQRVSPRCWALAGVSAGLWGSWQWTVIMEAPPQPWTASPREGHTFLLVRTLVLWDSGHWQMKLTLSIPLRTVIPVVTPCAVWCTVFLWILDTCLMKPFQK